MTAWTVTAHIALTPPPDGWRDALAQRLGHRPRRLGPWAELALHGARQCLDLAGETTLPDGALLRVASLRAATHATRQALVQNTTGLPMPFTFLQSQPSQMLAALCQHLAWRGDARFVIGAPDDVLRLTRAESGPEGFLLGWVDEEGADGTHARSEWWRITPAGKSDTLLASAGG